MNKIIVIIIIIIIIIQGGPEKNAQRLMRRHFATVCSRITADITFVWTQHNTA